MGFLVEVGKVDMSSLLWPVWLLVAFQAFNYRLSVLKCALVELVQCLLEQKIFIAWTVERYHSGFES